MPKYFGDIDDYTGSAITQVRTEMVPSLRWYLLEPHMQSELKTFFSVELRHLHLRCVLRDPNRLGTGRTFKLPS